MRAGQGVRKTAFSSLFNIGAYGTSQLLNLGFQAFLVWQFGVAQFGPYAFILSISSTLIALSDLGFTHHFIREQLDQLNGQAQWRTALFLRAVIVALIGAVAFIYYCNHFAGNSQAICFGAAASIAVFFSAFNPSPMLYALGSSNRAALVQPAQILTTVFSFFILSVTGVTNTGNSSILLGVCYCAGYMTHFIFYLSPSLGVRCAIPAPLAWISDRSLLAFIKPCLAIWSTGISGNLFARLGTLVVEWKLPHLLAAYYLLEQICNGIAGGLLQIQKVMIPHYAGLKERVTSLVQRFVDLWSAGVCCIYVLLLFSINIANSIHPIADLDKYKVLFLLFLAEKGISAYGSGLVIQLFVNRQEKIYASIVALSTAIGSVVVLLLVPYTSIEFLFVVRVLTVIAAFLITVKLTELSITPVQLLALASPLALVIGANHLSIGAIARLAVLVPGAVVFLLLLLQSRRYYSS